MFLIVNRITLVSQYLIRVFISGLKPNSENSGLTICGVILGVETGPRNARHSLYRVMIRFVPKRAHTYSNTNSRTHGYSMDTQAGEGGESNRWGFVGFIPPLHLPGGFPVAFPGRRHWQPVAAPDPPPRWFSGGYPVAIPWHSGRHPTGNPPRLPPLRWGWLIGHTIAASAGWLVGLGQ